jgi:fido (protein-threonine AMPylation protein)
MYAWPAAALLSGEVDICLGIVRRNRAFPTPDGLKNYTEVSDLIAEPLSLLVDDIQLGRYGNWRLDVDLITHFHRSFLGEVVPTIAGVWRTRDLWVGPHRPPAYRHVDRMMRECLDDIAAKVEYAGNDPQMQIEALAYTEARLLNIHPFDDFNGRAVRVLALELVRRFDLPVVRAWVEQGPESPEYSHALRAFDLYGWVGPMCEFWLQHRFE